MISFRIKNLGFAYHFRKPIFIEAINLKKNIMPTVVARHKVRDFDTWLKGHKDRVEIFSPSVSSFKTFQDSDDPNSVVLILEVTDMEKLVSMMNDPKNKELKDRHTVIEPITISMQVPV